MYCSLMKRQYNDTNNTFVNLNPYFNKQTQTAVNNISTYYCSYVMLLLYHNQYTANG